MKTKWQIIFSAALWAAANSLGAQTPAPTPSANGWDYTAFQAAFKASGRTTTLSEDKFNAVQEQKKKAYDYLKTYLDGKFKKANPAVLAGFEALPREYYHYNYQ